jgi:YD repeat-containing protein
MHARPFGPRRTGLYYVTTYTGSVDIVNNNAAFLGAGWSLAGYERIYSVTGGVIVDNGGGTNLWFANGIMLGTFVTPTGDTSTLVQNADNSYTRTLKDGTKYNFNSAGREISLVNTNNDAVTFSYNGSNQLTTVTDWNNQTTTLGYSGSYVQTITDPANRVTTLTHSSAQLTAINDSDGALWSYIKFDPLKLPAGMAPSDDPILLIRSPVYSESHRRREGENKQPSAITPADVKKGE